MTENPLPQTLNYSVPSARESRWGKGFLAVCGTFVFPGAGHILISRIRRGLAWITFDLVSAAACLFSLTHSSLTPLLLLFAPLEIIVFLAALVDAYLVGRESPRPLLNRPIWRYVVGVVVLIACVPIRLGIGHTYRAIAERAGTHVYAITSLGMLPTIRPGDRILTHRVEKLHRWDLVVFHPPGRTDIFTQRIVGLPGEKVEIVGGQIQIDNVPVSPPITIGPFGQIASRVPQTGCEGNPITLGPAEFYTLGDSGQAWDSRCWPTAAPGHQLGAVPGESIVGRVTAIIFPPRRIHQFK